jgi:ADP-heptose:LPS heptosyltransferase
MVTSLAVYLDQVFGIELYEEELEYEINVDDAARRAVDNWLAEHFLHRRSRSTPAMMPYVLFNLSVSDLERRISTDQAAALASHLSHRSDIRTVLLIAPSDREMSQAVQSRHDFQNCITYQTRGIMPLQQLASLVEGTLAVISPDTSIIHFASAMRTPILGIYTHSQGTKREWLPYRVRHELLIAPPGEPVSSIQHSALIKKADEFISSILRTGRQKSSEAL